MHTPAFISNVFNWKQAAIVAAVLLACASCRNHDAEYDTSTNTVIDADAPYHGIDISSHQRHIDWKLVAADKNIHFIYIKATEGATYQSPHYAYNVTMAHQAGVPVGSYHYLKTTSSINEQFHNFTRTAVLTSQDLIPMIDVESRGSWSRQQLNDSVALLARLLEEHYGRTPMIYSTMEFYNENLAPRFNKFPLYIARYSSQQPSINWEGKVTLWQFSDEGIIPGIDAYVDLSRFVDGHDMSSILLN